MKKLILFVASLATLPAGLYFSRVPLWIDWIALGIVTIPALWLLLRKNHKWDKLQTTNMEEQPRYQDGHGLHDAPDREWYLETTKMFGEEDRCYACGQPLPVKDTHATYKIHR